MEDSRNYSEAPSVPAEQPVGPGTATDGARGYLRGSKTYVIRAARMSPHQKRPLERYRDAWCIPVDELKPQRLEIVDVFGADRATCPLVLEIGFGMGEELAEIAYKHPDWNFIGIEVHPPGVGKLLGQIAERGLTNVRIIQHDAVVVCRSVLPPGTIDALHLFFPDPWPKKRHHKRRMVQSGFVEMVAPLLRRGGYLYAVTDWEDYAHQMLQVLGASDLLRNRYEGFAPAQSWRPRTAFEGKGLRKGHAVYELVFERLS